MLAILFAASRSHLMQSNATRKNLDMGELIDLFKEHTTRRSKRGIQEEKRRKEQGILHIDS